MREIRLNPFSVVSSVLLFIAPFASWATLSSFGFIVPATLWDISSNQTVFQVSATVAMAALIAGVLLALAALLSLRWTKLGLAFSVVAISMFSLESYSMYGTFGEGILATILPGAGLFIALSGILFGTVS